MKSTDLFSHVIAPLLSNKGRRSLGAWRGGAWPRRGGGLGLTWGVLSAVLLCSGAAALLMRRAPNSSPYPHRDHLAVATEHARATRVGMQVLREGGHAADAAVAVALTLGVAQPSSSGIGGGGFALAFDARSRKTTVLDFREVAPYGLEPEKLEFRPKKPMRSGRGTMIGVPGEVAGLVELHRRFGVRSFADDVAPAADLADQGYFASSHLETLARAYHEEIGWSAPLASLFQPGGVPVLTGQRVRNVALASTLRRIGQEGARAFYQGAVAEDIVATAASVGGKISLSDLMAYRVKEREALRFSWEGYEVVTMPPPSAGGLLLGETLGMFSREDLRTLQLGSASYQHVLAESFRFSLRDRVRAIGDPAFASTDVATLLAASRLRDERSRISVDVTRPRVDLPLKESGTAHFVVVDGEGNIVSLTTTINDAFGAKVATARTGIVLNNELDDFAPLKENVSFATTTRVDDPPNRPRPLSRPTSSMTPTLVFAGGEPVAAVGGSGGLRIATGVTQALLARLAFGEPALNCVSLARFHTPPEGGALEVEDGTPPEVLEELRRRGEWVKVETNYSAVQMVTWDRGVGGVRINAAADPRKGGVALVE